MGREGYHDNDLQDQGRNDFIEKIEKIMEHGPYLSEGFDGEATDLMVRIVDWAEQRPALYAIVETANGLQDAKDQQGKDKREP